MNSISGQKRSLIAAVLGNLGYEVPSDDKFDEAILKAVREYKSTRQLDPGPSVTLALVPLPGDSLQTPAKHDKG